MCEVATMAAVVGRGASMTMGVMSAKARGEFAQQVDRNNSLLAQRQAADAVQRGFLPAMRARMRGGQVIGAQEAEFGAGNVLVGSGSAGTTAAETRVFSDLEERVIRNNAAREAYGYRTQAQRFAQEGEFARSEEANAIMGSVVGGVGGMAQVGSRAWLDVPAASGEEG